MKLYKTVFGGVPQHFLLVTDHAVYRSYDFGYRIVWLQTYTTFSQLEKQGIICTECNLANQSEQLQLSVYELFLQGDGDG